MISSKDTASLLVAIVACSPLLSKCDMRNQRQPGFKGSGQVIRCNSVFFQTCSREDCSSKNTKLRSAQPGCARKAMDIRKRENAIKMALTIFAHVLIANLFPSQSLTLDILPRLSCCLFYKVSAWRYLSYCIHGDDPVYAQMLI